MSDSQVVDISSDDEVELVDYKILARPPKSRKRKGRTLTSPIDLTKPSPSGRRSSQPRPSGLILITDSLYDRTSPASSPVLNDISENVEIVSETRTNFSNDGDIEGDDNIARLVGSEESELESESMSVVDLTELEDDVIFVEKKRRVQSDRRTLTMNKKTAKHLKLMCPICQDEYQRPTSTSCGHIFCQSCIVKALERSVRCPTCRSHTMTSSLHRVYF